MQSNTAKKVAIDIFKAHGMSTNHILCDLFLETFSNGERKEPIVLGLTETMMIMIRRGVTTNLFNPALKYHILPLDSSHIYFCCTHYKKINIHTVYNEVYHMVLAQLGRGPREMENIWKEWTVGNPRLHIWRKDMKENYGMRGSWVLDTRLNDPFMDHHFENADVLPFDQNQFQKWLLKPQKSHTPEPKDSDIDSDTESEMDNDLSEFLDNRKWGDELRTDIPVTSYSAQADRLLYYNRDVVDEAQDIRLPEDSHLENAIRSTTLF